MQGRVAFVEELLETTVGMIAEIEDREAVEPDLAIVRELAEQLRQELETLE